MSIQKFVLQDNRQPCDAEFLFLCSKSWWLQMTTNLFNIYFIKLTKSFHDLKYS